MSPRARRQRERLQVTWPQANPLLGEHGLARISVLANMDEATRGKRVDGNLVGTATIRESPRAGATASRSRDGYGADETCALPEMFNYLAHLVA